MRRKYSIAILLLIGLVFGIIIYNGLLDNEIIRNYHIKEFNINANICNNGDMNVVEDTMYRFNGKYNGITITIPTNVSEEAYDKLTAGSINDSNELPNSLYISNGISNVLIYVKENGNRRYFTKVEQASIGDSNVYTQKEENGFTTYTIYEPSKNIDKQIVIEYTLKGVSVSHEDSAELYWNFVGGKVECNIKNLNINITSGGKILNTYIHGNSSGTLENTKSNEVMVKYKNVKPGQFVGTRVVLDKSSVNNVKKQTHLDAIPLIAKQESSYLSKTNMRIKLNVVAIVLSVIYFIYWIILLLKYEKEVDPIMIVMDDAEILNKYNPMIAACIAQNRDMHPRDIIAVIINLVNIKALNMQLINTVKYGDKVEEYIFEKNEEFFSSEENVKKLDEVELKVLDIFMGPEETKFELAQKLENMKDNKTTVNKLKELDQIVIEKLDKIGANLVKVPKGILTMNNIMFVLTCIYLLFVFGFNMALNNATLSASNDDLLYSLVVNVYCLLGVIIVLMPLMLYTMIFLLKLFHFIQTKIDKLVFKLTSKKFTKMTISILITFIIVIVLECIFLNSSCIIASTILFFVSILIVLTDNLISSHATKVQKDYVRLKILQDKIENGSLLNDKKVQDNILWNKYLTLAIALGVGDVAEYVSMIPDYSNLNEALNKLSRITDGYYSLYSLDRDSIFNERMAAFSVIAHKSAELLGNIIASSGGGSSGSSSFGGGGFSGGGGGGGGRGAF